MLSLAGISFLFFFFGIHILYADYARMAGLFLVRRFDVPETVASHLLVLGLFLVLLGLRFSQRVNVTFYNQVRRTDPLAADERAEHQQELSAWRTTQQLRLLPRPMQARIAELLFQAAQRGPRQGFVRDPHISASAR